MTWTAESVAREAWKKWLDALFEGHVEPSEPQPKWLAAMVPLFQAAHDADSPTPSTLTPIPAAEARHAYGVVSVVGRPEVSSDGGLEAVARAWRQCSDGLPEIGERVLVAVPSGARPVQEACRLHRYEEDTNWWWETPNGAAGRGYVILPESVSAWRPLPAIGEALTASRAPEMRGLLGRIVEWGDEKVDTGNGKIVSAICEARALLASLDAADKEGE